MRIINVINAADVLADVLETYKFTADRYIEDNGSVTLCLNEIDLAVNAGSEEEAIEKMSADILEYAGDYYNFFDRWYASDNRRGHLPYVIKAIMLNDTEKIGGIITCRPGEI